MRFVLSPALKDHILFSMEDQQDIFFVDTRQGMVIREEEAEDPNEKDSDGTERYISLPEWDSSDGYRLMEQFTAAFKNPLIRRELEAALDRSRGVFRAFKNVLSAHPEAEKLWYAHKEKGMVSVITLWYNALREEWGLDSIGSEPEEVDDLVLEDFRFRPLTEDDRADAEKLHRLCVKELELPEKTFPFPAPFPGSCQLAAESSGGAFAAQISAAREGGLVRIELLEVNPEYRGLGLGKKLLSRFLELLDADGDFRVVLELPAASDVFAAALRREKFTPVLSTWRRVSRDN
ncbi:MAG: GNAT family N-acetyltransferase [Spirochaetaceae bacterium]|jgi:ribosomal protein S18 acetylase RimI-like enzyme|nr:GNAT family N-acetyltransferase [Spirochaetaceae bacterium]